MTSTWEEYINMRVVFSNIMGRPRMSRAKAAHDIDMTMNLHGVTFWAEISNPLYKLLLKKRTNGGHKNLFLTTSVPITYSTDHWRVIDKGSLKLHGGKITASPARRVNWALMEYLDTGAQVVFMGTHYVSGAWNDKEKTFKRWRQKKWEQGYEKHKRLVRHFTDLGYTVIGGGDFNRMHVLKFHPNQKWYSKGIVKLFVIPSEHDQYRTIRTGFRDDNFSDHPIIHLTYTLNSMISK